MRCINSTSWGECIAPNRCNSLPYNVRTSRKGYLIKGLVVCYVRMDLWDGPVHCCGQDGYQAKVPQHSYISLKYLNTEFLKSQYLHFKTS